MKKTSRKPKGTGTKPIRQNRPGWRKKVIGSKPHPNNSHFHKVKIKSKDWENT